MEVENLLEVYQKNSRKYSVTVTKNGSPENVSNWTFYFVVKKEYGDSDDDAVIFKELEPTHDAEDDDPENGKVTWEISQDDTDEDSGMYVYDITYTEPNSPEKRQTLRTGDFKIKESALD